MTSWHPHTVYIKDELDIPFIKHSFTITKKVRTQEPPWLLIGVMNYMLYANDATLTDVQRQCHGYLPPIAESVAQISHLMNERTAKVWCSSHVSLLVVLLSILQGGDFYPAWQVKVFCCEWKTKNPRKSHHGCQFEVCAGWWTGHGPNDHNSSQQRCYTHGWG